MLFPGPGTLPPLEKLLANNLHRLDDHLTEHVTRLDQAVSIHQHQQVDQGKATRIDSHTKTSTQFHRPEYFCLKWLKLGLRAFADSYDKASIVPRKKTISNVYSGPHSFVGGCYVQLYYTQFVSTNERRAAFVLTNPIEVLRRI